MATDKSCVEGVSWKLRAGQPVPVAGCLYNPNNIKFVLQTFGAEKRVVKNYKATTDILESKDFIGLNPDAEFESANYSATQYITQDGEVVFTGQERKNAEYINEDEVPGVKDFYL
jgi:hypothetical protein